MDRIPGTGTAMNAEVHTFLVKNTTEHSQETLNHPDGFVLERQSRKLEMPQGSIKYMKTE